VIARASAVWTRDEHSLGVISELFGADGLPAHCRRGVDVAFLLSAVPPAHDKAAALQARLSSGETQKIGLNVSGLLYGMDAGTSEFGLLDDYRRTVLSIVRWFIQNTSARVFLVPHVSSDVPACKHVLDEAMTYANGRVEFIGDGLDQNELKWVIGQMDWFCGARMHASIAALSSFVPTVVLAYSDKAKGVFAECGQEQSVLDLRTMPTAEIVEALGVAWENRKEVVNQLQRDLPQVLQKASSQMDEIAAYCLGVAQ